MCLNDSPMLKLSFRHTFSDIMELNKYAPEVRLKANLVLSFAVILLPVVLIVIVRKNNPSEWIALGAVGMWFLLGLMVTRIAGFGAWMRSNRPHLSVEFSSAKVLLAIDTETVELGWDAFGYFYETPRLIVLRVPGDSIAIPKRAGEPDDILSLLRLLKKSLPTRPPSWRWYLN